ncbi:MAG: FMN-binding protein [Planctomycetes bacterium]|nr:FMN-binding protein [Planctomycetota bacterium]
MTPTVPSLLLAPFAALALVLALPSQGKVFLTTKEALALAFPKCEVVRKKHVLDDARKRRATRLAGVEPRRSMVYAYEARKDGELVGTAYFDRHRVRSKQELVMIVVDPRSKVRRIEVVSFEEPLDYLPRGSFYAQMVGRGLDAELSTKRAIRGVAGSTLTVNATVEAVRRVLAAHTVVYPEQVAKQRPERGGKRRPVGLVTR